MKADTSAFPNTYREGARDAISDILDVIDEHIPSLLDDDESQIVDMIARSAWEDFDVADYALRTCACGERIDGFYEYTSHLKAMVKALVV